MDVIATVNSFSEAETKMHQLLKESGIKPYYWNIFFKQQVGEIVFDYGSYSEFFFLSDIGNDAMEKYLDYVDKKGQHGRL